MKTIVTINKGLLQDKLVHQKIGALASGHVLIYDRILEPEILSLKQSLQPLCIALEAGEGCKTRAVRDYLEDALVEAGLNKDTVIIGCGGGTILDVVGLVASTFCRGCKLCFFPSTLLAMADAAIGGKNGINMSSFKNCIGTIYHPQHVFIDTALLQTLPEQEIRNGQAEILKLSLVCNRPLSLEEAIQTKMTIVENGQRELLNFGHTFGHAYEALMNFQVAHGQAVLLGMATETYIAYRMGHLAKDAYEAVQTQIGKPKIDRAFSKEAWLSALHKDKKNSNGNIHIVIPTQKASMSVPQIHIEQAIDWLQQEVYDALHIN